MSKKKVLCLVGLVVVLVVAICIIMFVNRSNSDYDDYSQMGKNYMIGDDTVDREKVELQEGKLIVDGYEYKSGYMMDAKYKAHDGLTCDLDLGNAPMYVCVVVENICKDTGVSDVTLIRKVYDDYSEPMYNYYYLIGDNIWTIYDFVEYKEAAAMLVDESLDELIERLDREEIENIREP